MRGFVIVIWKFPLGLWIKIWMSHGKSWDLYDSCQRYSWKYGSKMSDLLRSEDTMGKNKPARGIPSLSLGNLLNRGFNREKGANIWTRLYTKSCWTIWHFYRALCLDCSIVWHFLWILTNLDHANWFYCPPNGQCTTF